MKRFDVIMDYSLLDKIKFEYIKIVSALIEGNLPVKFRGK
jgi:hypothetical protein